MDVRLIYHYCAPGDPRPQGTIRRFEPVSLVPSNPLLKLSGPRHSDQILRLNNVAIPRCHCVYVAFGDNISNPRPKSPKSDNGDPFGADKIKPLHFHLASLVTDLEAIGSVWNLGRGIFASPKSAIDFVYIGFQSLPTMVIPRVADYGDGTGGIAISKDDVSNDFAVTGIDSSGCQPTDIRNVNMWSLPSMDTGEGIFRTIYAYPNFTSTGGIWRKETGYAYYPNGPVCTDDSPPAPLRLLAQKPFLSAAARLVNGHERWAGSIVMMRPSCTFSSASLGYKIPFSPVGYFQSIPGWP